MQRIPFTLSQPCGNIPITKGILWTSIGECLFAIVSILVHIGESVYYNTSSDDKTNVFLGVYFFIHATTIINAMCLISGIKSNNLRKCHIYLLISAITFLFTFATVVVHLCFILSVNLLNQYYEFIMFPLWLLFRPYPMWLVKCFIEDLIREKRSLRLRLGSSTVKVKPYQYQGSTDTLQSLTKRHGFEGIFEELHFTTEDEILMNQLKIDYNQPLKTGDNFAVSKGSFDLGNGTMADVAIKHFKPTMDVKEIKCMISEAKILASISSHQNMVKYHGICLENIHKGKIILVLEYCPKGQLEEFLHNIDKQSFIDQLVGDEYDKYIKESLYENIMTVVKEKFCTKDLIRWACEIASGMEYLHSKRIIHGNLSAKNIIVGDQNTMKIGGFTIAAHLYTAERNTTKNDVMKTPFPWRWMAIECMEHIDELNFTKESDVWSYGVTVWEIFSMAHSQPYEGMSVSDFFPKLKQGYRLERPCYASVQIYDILNKCWQSELKDRPNFRTLRGTLTVILNALNQTSDSDEEED